MLGDLLRSLRTNAGLTQDELAELSGLSVRTISDLERNRTARPYRHSVVMLADALGLSGGARAELVAAARGIYQPDGTPGRAGGASSGDPAALPGPPPPRPRSAPPPTPRQLPPTPRQLPPAMRFFVGRAAELKALDALLGQLGTEENAVITATICGMAGVGKTTLALHWAHRVADRFPDGQLYVNMRGCDPVRSPAAPAEVLRGFLGALNVPPARIPADPEAMTGLFRSLLAGRAMLVLLDNVRDAAQVRPLLPGEPACLVLVTSRSELTGLAAADGADILGLDVLTEPESRELLTQRLGAERLAGKDAAASDLIGLCARLPLALSIAAARVVGQRATPIADLVAGMRDTRDRLTALDTEDPVSSVRAVFSWSQASLSNPAARLFRLLGTVPGPEISVPAAAALAGVRAQRAQQLLAELSRASLVCENSPGRVGCHDLLHIYAAERAAAEEEPAEVTAATRRLITWYLLSASAAAKVISPRRRHVDVGAGEAGLEPLTFDGHRQAADWLHAERANLMAAISQAAGQDCHLIAWQLPVVLWDLFNLGGDRADWIWAVKTGLVSARRLEDRVAEGWLLNHLAVAYHQSGNSRAAIGCYQQALAIRRALRDRRGEAAILGNLGRTYGEAGQPGRAMEYLQQALAICQDISERPNQGMIFSHIADAYRQLGQFAQAAAWSRQALVILRRNGEPLEESVALTGLAQACLRLGQFDEAIAQAGHALTLTRELGDRTGEAQALVILGRALAGRGRAEEGGEHLRTAARILGDLGEPQAAQIRALMKA
jgi:tetratricopeptide (TPR) repeat protein/DNA-binding XRE family transcriptional regulator